MNVAEGKVTRPLDFDRIATEYGPRLRSFLSRRLATDPLRDVDDMTQEILLSAWLGLPGFRGDSSIGGWIFTIAKNQLYDDRRYRRTKPSIADGETRPSLEELPSPTMTPEEATIAREDLSEVLTSLTELSPELRDALVMHLAGVSYSEIAEREEIPMSTVKWRIFDARSRTRKRFPDHFSGRLAVATELAI